METTYQHPRMLSIRQTANTGILPESLLRTLVKQGRVPGIYAGRKFLVNYDKLCEWLNNSGNEQVNGEES